MTDDRHQPDVSYDREVLVNVLVYHFRKDNASCGCGWGEGGTQLGKSHPEHVAHVYEQSVALGTSR